ncbi:spore germination protein GerPB [Alkalibacillus haloalkaliphilus]|uniref:spore germination protein GerPB n=1 Tax=Alkalibacillus haloalkaliphilus TaxID=94136 RepID=UPI0002D31F43|nr:spore germination protein GerPB [Alkalibacillus haloalkaliphilus]
MKLTVHQQIHINFLKVDAITNSSVLQVGSSGSIQSVSNSYNTGEYDEPAEPAEPLDQPLVRIPKLPIPEQTEKE